MPRKVKVVEITDSTTYGDITDAVVEIEQAEKEENQEPKLEEVSEPEPPKPKAKAKRVAKPNVLERTDTELPETPPTDCRSQTQSKTGFKS